MELLSPGGGLCEKRALGQDLREQPPQEIWGKSIPSRRNMKGSPGLEMRQLRPASGRGGSDMGGPACVSGLPCLRFRESWKP